MFRRYHPAHFRVEEEAMMPNQPEPRPDGGYWPSAKTAVSRLAWLSFRR